MSCRAPHWDRHQGIARAIAAGANRLLPAEFVASECDGEISIEYRGERIGGFGVGSVLRSQPSPPESGLVEAVAANVLNGLQDFVSEEHTVPWPRVPNVATSTMALPRAAIREGMLEMWYEHEGAPVTEIAQVPLE